MSKDKVTKQHLFPLERARGIANSLVSDLGHHCDRIEIAGSIRRDKGLVGDIEIVCIPKTNLVKRDLFTVDVERDIGFIKSVMAMGEKIKGNPVTGKYMQRLLPDGIKVDIFTCGKENWGWCLMVRTGPWEHSKAMATRLKIAGYIMRQNHIYKPNPVTGDPIAIHVPEESDVYSLLGMPVPHPIGRLFVS